MEKKYDKISEADAEQAVRDYNEGTDLHTDMKNPDVDHVGRVLFESGLGRCMEEIEVQARWVADDYGGVREHIDQTAKQAAKNIYSERVQYDCIVRSISPLISKVPNTNEIEYLRGKFLKQSGLPQDAIVLAYKFLHFLRPDVFPPVDSHARRFYDVQGGSRSISAYEEALKRVQYILRGNVSSIDIAKLRRVDGPHYQGDIKLIDKIAYQLGGENA